MERERNGHGATRFRHEIECGSDSEELCYSPAGRGGGPGPLPERYRCASRLVPETESMLLRLFHALMPREERFFDHFEKHAGCIVAAAQCLRAVISGEASFEPAFITIRERESEADAVTKETLEAIHRTFITPFDRGDIHDLTTALDDIIDLIEEIVQRLAIYEISDFTPEMIRQSEILERCTTMLSEGMPLLRATTKNARALSDIRARIAELEGQGDRTLREGLRKLMKGDGNAIAIIQRKEIYELLEEAIDRCQDAADVIQGIVIEHV
jgi:uncharacterized protein Yka (UPF0111/DUF47 family)